MVTWGQNTVHTFGSANNTGAAAPGTPTAGGGLFGAPAPATTPTFGSPTAPSTTGGLFGTPSTTTAAPGTSLFGTPSTTGTSLFGAPAATTTPTTSLFGGTGGGLFGTPAAAAPAPFSFGSGAFGSTTAAAPTTAPFGTTTTSPGQAATQQQQIPAQAALQAHMDASARQEAARVMTAMEGLHAAYAGAVTATNAAPSNKDEEFKFVSIVYCELTPEQRQLQWMYGMGAGGSTVPVAPPKPPQVSETEWNKAVVRNPDPQNYMPVALVGADALQARLSWQQERANQIANNIATIQAAHDTSRERCKTGRRMLETIHRTHAGHRKKLLNIMKKIEVVRCMNLNLQQDEMKVTDRLMNLEKGVAEVRGVLADLQDQAHSVTQPSGQAPMEVTELPDKEQLFRVLKGHREEISALTCKLQKDVRDTNLLTKRVLSTNPPR